ncbi:MULTISPECIES: nucleotidyltransferase family protein [Paenibacillus]|uniref:Renal dipeptidase n=1 Tax=Paenibacillus campinasensis TaxID=66347 RepID=A0A268EZ59_9BACL|nr:nucleotidyltransferase family protein [Paenibacillus campinasensis]MUG65143.1 Renal dipeptidase [Paenibacillus campinasensis]PAD78410.1 hypothetical protein CHH67_06505 [Paenibacillus campinasensis]
MMTNTADALYVHDLSRELLLLLHLLGKRQLDTEALRPLTADLDWALFNKLVVHHRVVPPVYLALQEHSALVPEHVIPFLHRHYHQNMMKMLHLGRAMSQVREAFEHSGIRSLWLKGPLLALQLYGDMARRSSKDLDVLVDDRDVEKAREILIELGYVPEEEWLLNNWKRKSHHLSMEHPEHGVQVEIHWQLSPHSGKDCTFDDLWSRRKEIVLSGQSFYGIGGEDLLHYLAEHGARHGWFRLRWLLDIADLLPQSSSANMIAHLKLHGGRHYIGQALLLSGQLLSAAVPKALADETVNVRSYRLAGMALHYIKRMVQLNPVPEKSVAWHYHRYLFLLMSGKQRVAYIAGKLLPSSRDALMLPLPKPLRFLYYPLRPFLWFWRRMKQPSL